MARNLADALNHFAHVSAQKKYADYMGGANFSRGLDLDQISHVLAWSHDRRQATLLLQLTAKEDIIYQRFLKKK